MAKANEWFSMLEKAKNEDIKLFKGEELLKLA
jgi:hypothetical protein